MKKIRASLGFVVCGFISILSQIVLAAATITNSTLLLKLAAHVWFDGVDEYLYCCSLIGAKPDERLDELYTAIKEAYKEL